MDIKDKLNNHLKALAPHVARRETANLLREAVEEINKLRSQIAIETDCGKQLSVQELIEIATDAEPSNALMQELVLLALDAGKRKQSLKNGIE